MKSVRKEEDATKNMEANNALLICSGKKVNKSRKVKSESNMTQTRKEKNTSKYEKKTELTQTLYKE